MSLSKSVFTIGFLTILSRMAGYVRDMFIAATMGAGPLTDAFLVAFRLPNFFRRLFAEGAFNASFVPLFSHIMAEDGKVKAQQFLSQVMSIMIIGLFILTIIFQIFMPFIMYGFAPGFAKNPEQFDLTVYLTRITFPYLLFISLVSLFGGVLNTLGKFAAAAASPILLNICLIIGLFAFRSFTETDAHALSYGVALAGVVQAVFLYFSLRNNGFFPKMVKLQLSPDVKKLLKLMVPGTIGAGIVQINLWIGTIIATLVPNAVSYLYYADRISQLPLAVIGTAVGTALLPMLARQFKENKHKEALATQNRAMEIAMFFTIPAAAALFIIAYPVVSVLFERGKFTHEEGVMTAYALAAYATGLPAFVLLKILVAPFFAEQDTRTPVIYSAVSVVTNIVFNIAFVFMFMYIGIPAHIGIALGTSLSSWINVVMLILKLRSKKNMRTDKLFMIRMRGMIVSAALMSFVLYFGNMYVTGLGQKEGELQSLVSLAITIIAGGGTYFIAAHLTKAFDLEEIINILRRRKKKA